MNNQLLEFYNDVLSPKISAYRKNYSCQYSLLRLCENLRKALDEGKSAGLLLMDLSKAFDCLPHDLLAAKLAAYKMNPVAIKLLISYLIGRQQRVKLGEHKGDWMTMLKGVPQGSILGPSLFNIFLNDLMFTLKHTEPVNYADDNTLCAISDQLHDTIKKLEADSNIAIDWFAENNMQANPTKFQFLTTGNSNVVLTIKGAIIDQDQCVKLLGVNIDKRLDFNFHVETVVRKCAAQLNALRRQSKLLNTRAKLTVFNAFIKANLNYCPLVWINRNKTDLNKLEKIQERAVRLIYNDKTSSYNELLRKAAVPSVHTRWQRSLATEVYKAVKGISPSYIQTLFKQKHVPYSLRNKTILLQPRCTTTRHGLNSITYQGARLWNTLPQHIQNAKSVSVFHGLINKHIT